MQIIRSKNEHLVTVASCLLALVVSTVVVKSPRRAMAQNNQANQDCEKIKQEIKELNNSLTELSADLGRLNAELDDVDQRIERVRAIYKAWQEHHKNSLNPFEGAVDPEAMRGIFLDRLAELANLRHSLKNAIEEWQNAIEATKEVITDLLNKLGNCGSKPPTSTPSPSPKPSPSPTSNPPENKNVGMLPGYHVDTNTSNGLYVTTVTTPQGKIKVNLTDDIVAGDTIAGTVETEPAGKNDAERGQNQTELKGYVVALEGQRTKVGDKKIFCNIRSVLTPGPRMIFFNYNGQQVVTSDFPILATPPPIPNQLTLPTGGQQGRTIECRGNFNPIDQVKIGGVIMPPIAQSPRKLVVRNTSEAVGPTTIECSQHGVVSQCPFRNLAIKLSAPKLNLQRGETTTLHVSVTGLAGITQNVPLDLVNNSPNVISMSGGEVQHLSIQPTQVKQDGTASFDFTLTGKMAGAFGIAATVNWDEVCKRPPN